MPVWLYLAVMCVSVDVVDPNAGTIINCYQLTEKKSIYPHRYKTEEACMNALFDFEEAEAKNKNTFMAKSQCVPKQL